MKCLECVEYIRKQVFRIQGGGHQCLRCVQWVSKQVIKCFVHVWMCWSNECSFCVIKCCSKIFSLQNFHPPWKFRGNFTTIELSMCENRGGYVLTPFGGDVQVQSVQSKSLNIHSHQVKSAWLSVWTSTSVVHLGSNLMRYQVLLSHCSVCRNTQ